MAETRSIFDLFLLLDYPSSESVFRSLEQVTTLSTTMSSTGGKQKLIEQLRAEASVERVKVSTACKDLINFCQDHKSGDVLVLGWDHYEAENPYKDKQGCVTL